MVPDRALEEGARDGRREEGGTEPGGPRGRPGCRSAGASAGGRPAEAVGGVAARRTERMVSRPYATVKPMCIERRQAVFPAPARRRSAGQAPSPRRAPPPAAARTAAGPRSYGAASADSGRRGPRPAAARTGLARDDQPDDHGSPLSVTPPGSRPAARIVIGGDEVPVHRKLQFRILPGHQAVGRCAVLDGVMDAVMARATRPPPPRRRGHRGRRTARLALPVERRSTAVRRTIRCPGADQGWAVLVPGRDGLLRNRCAGRWPRAPPCSWTLALVADLLTRGSLATVVMFTDLVYAAVLDGSPGAARRIPWITGADHGDRDRVAGLAAWHKPEGLLIGAFTGLVTFTPAAPAGSSATTAPTAVAERLRADRRPCSPRWTAPTPSPPNEPGWHGSCTTWWPTISPRSRSTPRPRSPSTTRTRPGTRSPSSVRTASRACGDAPADRDPARRQRRQRRPRAVRRTHPRRTRRPGGRRPHQRTRRHAHHRARQGARPGPARRVPHRPGVADQRPQARARGPCHGDAHPAGRPPSRRPPVRTAVRRRPRFRRRSWGRRERADLLGGSFEAGPEPSPDSGHVDKHRKGGKDGKDGDLDRHA